MNNKYCGTLLVIMVTLILVGAIMALNLMLIGVIPFIIGCLMTSGLMTLNPSPREVGIISFLGKKTDCVVEGLVLLFKPFGWKIVDVVVIVMRKVDETIPIDRVTCSDDAVVTGNVSISISPDDSSGETLKQYDDAGQLEGIIKQIDDMLLTGVQKIAKNSGRDSTRMISEGVEIGKELQEIVEGVAGIGRDSNTLDDTRGLGFKINKLQIKLRKTDEVIEAEQRSVQTDIMHTRIKKRIKYYEEKRETVPSIADIRNQLMEEDRNTSGLIKEIRGGNLVNFSDGSTDKPIKGSK
jgi:hypothetical protein